MTKRTESKPETFKVLTLSLSNNHPNPRELSPLYEDLLAEMEDHHSSNQVFVNFKNLTRGTNFKLGEFSVRFEGRALLEDKLKVLPHLTTKYSIVAVDVLKQDGIVSIQIHMEDTMSEDMEELLGYLDSDFTTIDTH